MGEGSQPIRVLIADDAADMAARIAEALEEHGMVIVGRASDGEAALRLAQETQPDVALLDVNMPRLSGLEVARALTSGGCRSLLLMMSSHDEPALKEASLSRGAAAFFSKREGLEPLLAFLQAYATKRQCPKLSDTTSEPC